MEELSLLKFIKHLIVAGSRRRGRNAQKKCFLIACLLEVMLMVTCQSLSGTNVIFHVGFKAKTLLLRLC